MLVSLLEESRLAPDIQFPPYTPHKPQAAFLTGGTGFLGVHILADLLSTTTLRVYCLVRATNEEDGLHKLHKQFQFYQLPWHVAYEARITVLPGDLARPALGLTETRFQALAEQVDIIYHCGAQVNFIRPYATLKAANVGGTQQILRLASLVCTKPVHYVSSTALFLSRPYTPNERILETDAPLEDSQLKNGYGQSKWVGEALLRAAHQRGLPTAAYRAPGILASARNGIMRHCDDPWWVLINGCIRLGLYPDLPRNVMFVPVDYVSRAIVHISLQPESVQGEFTGFYVGKPGDLPTWQHLFRLIGEFGYKLREVPYATWRAALKQQIDNNPGDKLFAQLTLLLNSVLFQQKPTFDARLTQQFLSGSGIHCPEVDKRLLTTYFEFLWQNGQSSQLRNNQLIYKDIYFNLLALTVL